MMNFFNLDINTILSFLKDNIKEGEGFIIEKKEGNIILKDLKGNIISEQSRQPKKVKKC